MDSSSAAAISRDRLHLARALRAFDVLAIVSEKTRGGLEQRIDDLHRQIGTHSSILDSILMASSSDDGQLEAIRVAMKMKEEKAEMRLKTEKMMSEFRCETEASQCLLSSGSRLLRIALPSPSCMFIP
jgi:hypothetical protein